MPEQLLTDSELVVVGHDRLTGTKAVIAVDDTTLGPGLGGVRWKGYPSEAAAVTEAQRLATGMTLKHAAAGLPYGGAKSVIFATATSDRTEVMRAFGRFVARLGGLYIPGVDMGTTVDDLAVVGTQAEVSCDEEDPSPATAIGVFHAIRAAVRAVYGSDLSGRSVAIQGVGHVGSALAALLADDGAKVLAADADPERAISVADSVDGLALPAEEVVTYPADVFAPCAAARVITTANIKDVGARIVAGAANDVLAGRGCAALLQSRGITYVPDFVANGGGVIHIHSKRARWTPEDLGAALSAIGTRVSEVLERSDRFGVTPLESAEQLASERIGRSVQLPD